MQKLTTDIIGGFVNAFFTMDRLDIKIQILFRAHLGGKQNLEFKQRSGLNGVLAHDHDTVCRNINKVTNMFS